MVSILFCYFSIFEVGAHVTLVMISIIIQVFFLLYLFSFFIFFCPRGTFIELATLENREIDKQENYLSTQLNKKNWS
jgi:hypothetical protein